MYKELQFAPQAPESKPTRGRTTSGALALGNHGGGPATHSHPLSPSQGPQMESLRAFAGKAFTIFPAGFTATFTSFPNIIRLPAFVAGLCFSFNVTRCGI